MRRDHGGAPNARIDASVNVNPFGPPRSLDAVFARAPRLARVYPEIDAASAREAWADKLGVSFDQVLIGNGASELISLVIRAVLPERVVVLEPCYSEYAAAATASGIPVYRLPMGLDVDAWRIPTGSLVALGDLGPGDMLVVGRPDNPTGHMVPADLLFEIASRGSHVLVDESFLDLATCDEARSLVSHVDDRLSFVTSLTKTYCVPGLRLGFMVCCTDLADRMSELRYPWSVNGIAAESAVALAGEDAYVREVRSRLKKERTRLAARYAGAPLHVTDGCGPWLLARLPEGVESPQVCTALLERGIAVRDASTFHGLSNRWIRVGIRTSDENDEVFDALAGVLGDMP